MHRFFMLVLCVGLFSIVAAAQGDSAGAKSAVFNDLLARVKGGDTSVDFKVLRFAFAEQGGPDVSDPKIHGAMQKAILEKKFGDALKITEAIQKTAYVDMNSHIIASMAHQALGDAKKAKFHEAVYLGLINSIVKESDGNTPKTAYVVISLIEVPVVLNALELKRTAQSIVEEDGHKYGLVTATDKNTNETVKLYFNIDLAEKGIEKVVKN